MISFQAPHRTALFYPCCGNDIDCPIEMFSDHVSEFFFSDIKRINNPKNFNAISRHSTRTKISSELTTGFYENIETENRFQLHRWRRKGQEIIEFLPPLGVFFYRRDCPNEGEGSSGVLWLGGNLFPKILNNLVSGGLIVTDGSNLDSAGPRELGRFWQNRNIGEHAKSVVQPFTYLQRRFNCIGYAGEGYGPTLVWKVE